MDFDDASIDFPAVASTLLFSLPRVTSVDLSVSLLICLIEGIELAGGCDGAGSSFWIGVVAVATGD